MCGITGFLTLAASQSSLHNTAMGMANALIHRGPDDAGVWVDETAGLAIAHRRLAVVDLSSAGQQPMMSNQGRYVIAFNGEIYNHLEIRRDIEFQIKSTADGMNLPWRGHSDTETLLAGFELWGIEETLKRSVGMFAIAVWDKKTQTLTLARDRFGEKPLFYGHTGGSRTFVFGSELKAIKAHPDFQPRINRQALARYLQFMYVPAPLSIYEDIHKLEPGCTLSLNLAAFHQETTQKFEIKPYWRLFDTVLAARNNPIHNETDAVNALYTQLKNSVQMQSQADVPLGAFLSGGVDSSLIVALMQQHAQEASLPAVKTFTIGFEESGYDESAYARAIADYLGTEHHEFRVDAASALKVIPDLPTMYDEPFADSSQIPTHLVSAMARQHVTVALSGDAGDELFGGYNRYLWGPRVWSKVSWMTPAMRKKLGELMLAIPTNAWNVVGVNANQFGDKVHKVATLFNTANSPDDLYYSLVTEWKSPSDVVKMHPKNDGDLGGAFSFGQFDLQLPEGLTPAERMIFLDTLTYLPDDILCKVDRAAMACSLETRVPFLDHRVAEMAWRLPIDLKIKGMTGKRILRQLLYRYVPKELIERPKAGFAIPIGQWLRGPLKQWAEELLNKSRLDAEGYFHSEPILARWKEHLGGKRDHTASLWAVLMFQAWLRKHQEI